MVCCLHLDVINLLVVFCVWYVYRCACAYLYFCCFYFVALTSFRTFLMNLRAIRLKVRLMESSFSLLNLAAQIKWKEFVVFFSSSSAVSLSSLPSSFVFYSRNMRFVHTYTNSVYKMFYFKLWKYVCAITVWYHTLATSECSYFRLMLFQSLVFSSFQFKFYYLRLQFVCTHTKKKYHRAYISISSLVFAV